MPSPMSGTGSANRSATGRKATLESVVTAGARYIERLRTPWWWYLGAALITGVLGGEFAFAVSGWLVWIPILVLIPIGLALVWRLSAGTITVSATSLLVAGTELALADIDRAIGLTPAELRRLVGRHSDPAAFVYVRSWVGPGVQLVLSPATTARSEYADLPVPYWVLSTRYPERLLSTLRDASVPLQ
jgi:hypothetical protein